VRPAPDYLRTVFNRLERFIEDRWEVPVHIQDVPNPFTGDLDGEQIMVDYDLEIEDAVFILIHLFGHNRAVEPVGGAPCDRVPATGDVDR